MTSCPSCGSRRVFRSKTRTALERFRRQFTMKRPYRCHACSWRGWAPDGMQAVAPQDVVDAPAVAPDLSAIDAAIAESSEKPER
jgi:DNA-directed RNA polymerase subunit RPC12/RpoP